MTWPSCRGFGASRFSLALAACALLATVFAPIAGRADVIASVFTHEEFFGNPTHFNHDVVAWSGTSGIYIRDLNTATTRVVATGSNNRNPRVGGTWVAWSSVDSTGLCAVKVLDLVTAQTRSISSAHSLDVVEAAGSWVIARERLHLQPDMSSVPDPTRVAAVNVNTGELVGVTPWVDEVFSSAGNSVDVMDADYPYVVTVIHNPTGGDTYGLFDLRSSKSKELSSISGFGLPRLGGSTLARQVASEDAGYWDVKLVDLESGEETTIPLHQTTDAGPEFSFDFNGEWLVWNRKHSEPYPGWSEDDVFGYCLSRPGVVRIAGGGAGQFMPFVGDHWVTWMDGSTLKCGRLPVPADLGKPTLSITPPSQPTVGIPFDVRCRLTAAGLSLRGAAVGLEKSVDGVKYTSVGSTVSPDVDGYAHFTLSLSRASYLRTRVLTAPSGCGAPVSAAIKVVPKHWIANPSAPSSVVRGRNFTVKGALKPQHASGTFWVRIYRYRNVSGSWRSYGYIKAAVSQNGASESSYAARLSVPYKGKWRLRSYAPPDARHASAWSKGYVYLSAR